MSYMDRAACRDADSALFFPSFPGDLCLEAQRLCRSCPVVEECLAEALRLRDTYGFRGGKTGDERRKLLPPKPNVTDEIRRLRGKGWTNKAICQALGVSDWVVHRAVAKPREAA